MLGKLLKYEWKGLRFPLLIMLIILAGTTALTCSVILTINPRYDETIAGYLFMTLFLSIFLYYFGLIGCILGTTIIIVIRFYKTCYTDQGYLTHTLPVSTRQILNAKLLTSIFVYLLMIFAIAATIFIIIEVALHHIFALFPYDYREFLSILYFFEDELGIHLRSYISYTMIYSIISTCAHIVILFGCVSLGQLYAKHRVAGAVIAYFIQQFLMNSISSLCTIPIHINMFATNSIKENSTFGDIIFPSLNLQLFLTVIMAAAMYFVNLHMMTKKLNLE